MKTHLHPRAAFAALSLAALLAMPTGVMAAPPDLTATGVIATIDKTLTYNLGPTGLRGWIYISGGNVGADGFITGESRQILVTVAGTGTPASGVLAVDDVILGVGWGTGSDPVPPFASDARKSFGAAIGEAEKSANNGILKLKRWRAGVTTDVAITLAVMGSYTNTAPYTCPKSALVLANARDLLVNQLLANPSFLSNNYGGAIEGLALLASVEPGHPNYATVQTRLQSFARSLAPPNLTLTGCETWNWGYIGVFLSEYYLSTGDTSVLDGINKYTVALAKGQSRYGTYGHGGALLKADGSLHGTIPPYGPVNQAGIPANIAIVMGKKALLAAAMPIDPELDPAIQRGSDFFAWYVNKGPIPYGEHEPYMEGHASNGKDALCAVLFGLQDNRLVETEYFARMTTAGFPGREYGHTGQGFSFLWGAMGAHMGGALAAAEYLKPVRWHLDLERRTDGSFVYDGGEQYGAGKTADGTYLGACGYYDINPTASYILTYALPLQRLHITGKNANPANTLDATKVANAIAAATFKQDCVALTTTQLIAALSEFDPVVRNYAAIELATRTLTTAEVNTLIAMITDTRANARMGACQTLGILKNATAMPMITQRLSDPDLWVRAKAASALRSYGSAASTQRDPMLTAFAANATDPDVIVWNDPVQIANGYLCFALFGDAVYGGNNIATYTINAPKNLLYPAVQAGLKQPDSKSRQGAARFSYNYLTLADVEALILDLFEVVETESQADTMWSMDPRGSGIATLAKHKISEGIPMALAMQVVPTGFGWNSDGFQVPGLNALAAYGDASRWTLPTLRGYLDTWSPTSDGYPTLVNTITSIENAITSPTQIPGLPVAYSQVVTTVAAKAITLTGFDVLGEALSYTILTQPAHGTLTGTAPNVTYTPAANYSGVDCFTFKTHHGTSDSQPATVSLIVGVAGTGLKGEYFDNVNFTNPKVTRTDAQVNFDWATGSPDASIGVDTFSVRWSGLLLVPETGTYMFSTLNSDGIRLYINGVLMIDDYVDQTTNWKDGASVNLTAGQMVDLQLEYYENTGPAVAKLKWTGPSFAGANGLPIAKEWLYNGSGVANRTPYAHAQSVTLMQNTPQTITLTGSGGTLAYTIITQPAHGTLTGTTPNLTYTPAANFNGSDSFTFLVNNGTSNSSPATVSIAIWSGLPVDYFWTTAVSGNWSGATSWSNAAGATFTPAATGQPIYRMSFNKSGIYTATQDLNNGFLLNQLNVAGTVTFAGTNSLAFAANGSILPQFNQNSTNAVIISNPLNLTAMTSFGGASGGQVTLQGVLSGAGGLTKNNAGTLQITNVTNTYSGGTVLNAGTVSFVAGSGAVTPFFGTGPVTINSPATLSVNRSYLTNSIMLNGATVTGGNSFSSYFSGPVTLTGMTTFNFGTTGGFTISGNMSGTGGLTTLGTTLWHLSGTNTYTGPTSVQAGTLSYDASVAVGPGALSIGSVAKIKLNYTGNRTIASLTLAGTTMPPGSYGSTASPAANKNDSCFSGAGTVTVLPATTTALSLTGGISPSDPGAPLTFTATVTGSSPTGNVSFHAGTTLLGSSPLNGSFQAGLTTSSLAIGSYHITAQYAGNATHAASTSAAVAVEITSMLAPPPTQLLALPGNHHIALTWTGSAGASFYYVKRSLTHGGPYSVIGISDTAGYIDLTSINGTSYYYVVSAFNAAGESADSTQVSGIPALPPSNTTVTSSLGNADIYGAAVTFTATVAVSGGTATGTVTFKDGATVLGTGALDGSGQASFNAGVLAVGGHPITASYGGDTAFGSSVSPGFNYAVNAKPVTIDGLAASSKVYDGTTAAILSGGAVTGVLGGESVTVVVGAGTFASPNAGTWAVTVSGCSLGGGNAGNYVLAVQPSVANASIAGRPVVLTGTRAYDGTVAATGLSVANNLDGANLTVTGTASLVGKDTGTQAILVNDATPVRVRSATGNTGTDTATTFSVTMAAAPAAGNSMIAVISTRGSSDNRVSGITQTGAVWARATQTSNANGTTTEIWYASNLTAGAGTAVAITQAALRSAAVVMEYSGVLAPSPVDQTNGATGSSTTPVTGTTATTTQAHELWIGGIGFIDSTPTLSGILNNFSSVTSAQSTQSTASSNAKVYALERIVNTTGAAGSGGTLSPSAQWSGAIATFKAAMVTSLALAGPAAGNYTLTGMSGAMTITPKDLTLTANHQNKTYGQTVTFGSGSTQFTSSGLQNGETIGSVTLACSGGAAAAGVADSPYPITPSAATGGTFAADNYMIHYQAGLLTVDPVAMTAYETWAADPAQGLTAGVNNGPADDPDHDGMTNQQEFAFGLNPTNGSSVNPVTLPLDPATTRFQYTRRAGSGLIYQIFTCTNLGNWIRDAGASELAVTTSGDIETVTVQVSSLPVDGSLFVRVQAQ